jgi:hypothetical protein
MNKKVMSVAFAIVLMILWSIALGPSAEATPLSINDSIKLYDGPGTTNGGEFRLYHKEGASYVYNFNTFCMERDEYFSYGQELIVDDISNQAWNGGKNTDAGDPLDDLTAWLYLNFQKGTLAGYDYGAGRVASANALQNAIWYFEEEIGSVNAAAQAFVTLAQNAYDGGWRNNGQVWVLNLTYTNGRLAQDQLYVKVPEPANMLLLGTGLICLAGIGRRKLFK